MFKVEKKALNFIEEKKAVIAIVVFSVLGLIIRFFFRDYKTSDYSGFLELWFNELKEYGGLKGIAYYGGNYNYAYVTILALLTYIPVNSLYSIKMVSVLFDILCAVVSGLIVMKTYKGGLQSFAVAFSIVFLSPIVMFNSAFWSQCDSIYASFVFLSIFFLLDEKYKVSFLMFGVAIAFKLQAIFILPLLILVYAVNKKFSIFDFLFAPLSTVIVSLPGMIFSGRGIKGFINTYVGQMGDSNMLSKNFPNIYYWLPASHYELFNRVGIVFTMAVISICFFVVFSKTAELTNRQILSLALWVVLCCVYFLPNMHERYGYVAEILCIIWAFGNLRWAWYPIVMNTIILFCYFTVLFGYNLYLFQNMGALNIILFVLFSMYIFKGIMAKGKESEKIRF